MTKVVNIRTTKDFGTLPGDVYIGRYNPRFGRSKWANPFTMREESDRDEVIEKYRHYLETSGLIHSIGELRGCRLGCWCKPARCHGDVLAELAGGKP